MTYEEMVNGLYSRIINRASSSILFGMPVDINNVKVLVVASYFIGKQIDIARETVIVDGVFNAET